MTYAGGKIEPRKVYINVLSLPRRSLKNNKRQRIRKGQKNKQNSKKKWLLKILKLKKSGLSGKHCRRKINFIVLKRTLIKLLASYGVRLKKLQFLKMSLYKISKIVSIMDILKSF